MVDPKLYEEIKQLVASGKNLTSLYNELTPKGYREDKIAEAFKLANTTSDPSTVRSGSTQASAVDTSYEKVLIPVVKSENRSSTVIITTNDIPLLKIVVLIIVLVVAFIFVLITGVAILGNKSVDPQNFFQIVSQKAVTSEMVDTTLNSSLYNKQSFLPPTIQAIWESIAFFFNNIGK